MRTTHQTIISRCVVALTLLLGAMSVASAENRLYLEPVNIEPGETRSLPFLLDNSEPVYGFQADLTLPEGLEVVTAEGKPSATLSDRADSSYSLVTNLLNPTTLRMGAFSLRHTPLTGESGAILYLDVKASDGFTGGTLKLTDILLTDAEDKDMSVEDFSLEIGTEHRNLLYIPDFSISTGETKEVSVILENETAFTAFQTDIYMPEGLTVNPDSFKLSGRAGSSHSVAAMSFTGGRTRVTCFSPDNGTFTGNSGVLMTFEITADTSTEGVYMIDMRNQIFSSPNARETVLPDSETECTVEFVYVPVESIEILCDEPLNLPMDKIFQLEVEILPAAATDKTVIWSSSDPEVLEVSEEGLLTPIALGEAVITAQCEDKTAQCAVTVSVSTGVKGTEDGRFGYTVSGTTLLIHNLNESAILFDMTGTVCNRWNGNEKGISFELEPSRPYILKIGNAAFKICAR